MAEFIDDQTEVEGLENVTEHDVLEEALRDLFDKECNCKQCDICLDKDFINDDEIEEESVHFYRSVDNNEKRECPPSTEKLKQAESELRGKRRALFRDEDSGIENTELATINSEAISIEHHIVNGEVHYTLTEEQTQDIENLLEQVEELEPVDNEPDAHDFAQNSSTENAMQRLRSAFFKFSVNKEGALDQGEGKSFFSLHKEMKNERTMQRNWAIFLKTPSLTQTVALEAALNNDCDRIRTKKSDTHTYFLLEYMKKQRSMNGLKQVISTIIKDTDILLGVPKYKDTQFRTWAKLFTTLISETAPEISGLLLDCEAEGSGFNVEELFEWIEATEPKSIEVMLCNYREEARIGNPNAKNWLASASNITVAKKQFELWKSTIKGREMQLTVEQYILQRLMDYNDGDKDKVQKFLTYQGIMHYELLNVLRNWLHGKIKKSVICIFGPGNSGKSTFADALIEVLKGVRLCWDDNNSFWKQAAIGKRYCLLDDVTMQCWRGLDSKERRSFDGGIVAVNKKFCEATEMKMPPLILTSNYDIRANEDFVFLVNRVTFIHFPKSFSGNSEAVLQPADIAAYLLRHRGSLDF